MISQRIIYHNVSRPTTVPIDRNRISRKNKSTMVRNGDFTQLFWRDFSQASAIATIDGSDLICLQYDLQPAQREYATRTNQCRQYGRQAMTL